MALLSTNDLRSIKNDINNIIRDTSINVEIKYRQFVGQHYYNPENQIFNTGMYNDWSGVSAIRGLITQNEANKIGNIQIGDTKFVFMQSSVSVSSSGSTISVSDLIVDFSESSSGTTYDIVKFGYDPLGIVNICYGRVK